MWEFFLNIFFFFRFFSSFRLFVFFSSFKLLFEFLLLSLPLSLSLSRCFPLAYFTLYCLSCWTYEIQKTNVNGWWQTADVFAWILHNNINIESKMMMIMMATTLISNEIVFPHFVYGVWCAWFRPSTISLSLSFSTELCSCNVFVCLHFVLHGYFTTGFTIIYVKYTHATIIIHLHKKAKVNVKTHTHTLILAHNPHLNPDLRSVPKSKPNQLNQLWVIADVLV